jgi:quercetin dioxygenase-like cupin family protein
VKNKEYSILVEKEQYPTDPIVPIDDIFKDARGEIINLLFSSINSVAIITSEAGTVRSNHWHRSNWHYLYVISGSMKYLERNVDSEEVKEIICKKGDFIFTAPNKVHRTEFLENTVLLSLGKDPKNHEKHEEDLVRVEF